MYFIKSVAGFNKDEASLFIFDVIANLTKKSIEEDPYGAFVSSAIFLGTSLRVSPQILLLFLTIFFKIVCLDEGPFCGATACSYFGLCVSFLIGFKSRVDIEPALFLSCVL